MDAKRRSSGRIQPTEAPEIIGERVAIVIVNYRTPELTENCLSKLKDERRAFRNLRVLVVDGGSGDGSAERLAVSIAGPEFHDWIDFLALPINGGFGWANNQAIYRLMASSESPLYIHLLNPDAEIEPWAVSRLASYLNRHSNVGAVGSQLLEPDGSCTDSAFTFPTLRGEFSRTARTALFDRILRVPPLAIRASSAIQVDWATGASVMLRTQALRDAGLFDEGFFLYHEEVELMWRFRRFGWHTALETQSRVRHIGGSATGVRPPRSSVRVLPRNPKYWLRSRVRLLALTRGIAFAAMAFLVAMLGYAAWYCRKYSGLASAALPVDHGIRDHLAYSFPRRWDALPAIAELDAPASCRPAWMERETF